MTTASLSCVTAAVVFVASVVFFAARSMRSRSRAAPLTASHSFSAGGSARAATATLASAIARSSTSLVRSGVGVENAGVWDLDLASEDGDGMGFFDFAARRRSLPS